MLLWPPWQTQRVSVCQYLAWDRERRLNALATGVYEGIVTGLTTGTKYWTPQYSFVFCKAEQQPYPFVKVETAKDYVNFLPPEEQNKKLSEISKCEICYVCLSL